MSVRWRRSWDGLNLPGWSGSYEEVSERLGERVALSEGLLTFFGDQFLNLKEPEKAVRYYKMAATAYPGSTDENVKKTVEKLRAQ
jgi:hypothetical protein